MAVAAARGSVQAERQGVQRAPGHLRVGQGGQRQTVMRGPGQRGGRARISAGPGRAERVPVEGGTQHRCWRAAPPGVKRAGVTVASASM
jgi:hypothetical protein